MIERLMNDLISFPLYENQIKLFQSIYIYIKSAKSNLRRFSNDHILFCMIYIYSYGICKRIRATIVSH